MSIIGYIIGLGDRHLDNVLVDLTAGEVSAMLKVFLLSINITFCIKSKFADFNFVCNCANLNLTNTQMRKSTNKCQICNN